MMLTLAPGWGMSLESKWEQQVHEQGRTEESQAVVGLSGCPITDSL